MTPSRLTLSVAAALAAVALSACSGASEEPDSDAATASDSPTAPSSAASDSPATSPPTESETVVEGPLLEVVIAGDKVSPNAIDLRVGVGETLTVTIDSDRAGELHVHSKPEQYVEFGAGTSEHDLVITTPGEVEVEDHDTGAVVALIEVR